MAKVLGIGGVFFKAPDKAAVKEWYGRVLGLEFAEWGSAMFANPTAGFQQLTGFAADSGYFPGAFMINLIVDDLDGVLAKAAAAGESPLKREDHEYGNFAWFLDPVGTKIELWEPKGESPV